jgi:hypothetical protein
MLTLIIFSSAAQNHTPVFIFNEATILNHSANFGYSLVKTVSQVHLWSFKGLLLVDSLAKTNNALPKTVTAFVLALGGYLLRVDKSARVRRREPPHYFLKSSYAVATIYFGIAGKHEGIIQTQPVTYSPIGTAPYITWTSKYAELH